MSQSSSQFDVSSVNDAQHSSSLVCVWSVAAKVSAGFTNVRSLAVAAFELVYCSLSVLRLSLSLTLVSRRRKVVMGLCAKRIL